MLSTRPKTASQPSGPTRPQIIVAPPKLTPLDDIPTSSLKDLEAEYSDPTNLDLMSTAHNNLIKTIIDKEEDLISKHRTHIDTVVEVIK
jgi:hypothetical protein